MMNIPAGKILSSYIERKTRKTSDNSNKWLHFLSAHKNIHKLLVKFIKAKFSVFIITFLCGKIVKKYKNINIEDVFQRLKDFRNFSEDTNINALNEICELTTSENRVNLLSEIINELDSEQKAKFLKRIFYNIIINGLNRKIINIRLKENKYAVPNLTTLLLASSSKCNLNCIDCERNAEQNDSDATYGQLEYIIQQAKRLNIFHVVIIGKGEPLNDDPGKEILFRLIKKHCDLNFILFTNGTTLEERDIIGMRDLDNLFTLVSIDGLEQINDSRRGIGVYKKIINTLEIMKRHKLLYGFSATVFKENYHHILSGEFLNKMMEIGCKIGFYLMFLPVHENSNGKMILSESEVREYRKLYSEVKEKIPILDPEIFEQANGCRAKRGSVIYIDATTGKVMPCVKTPYAPDECNIFLNPHKNRLLEILKTDFFTNYRKSYTKCSQCSLDLPNELNQFLVNQDVSLGDKEKVEQFLRNIINEK